MRKRHGTSRERPGVRQPRAAFASRTLPCPTRKRISQRESSPVASRQRSVRAGDEVLPQGGTGLPHSRTLSRKPAPQRKSRRRMNAEGKKGVLGARLRPYPAGRRAFPSGNQLFPSGNQLFPSGNKSIPAGWRPIPATQCKFPGGFRPLSRGKSSTARAEAISWREMAISWQETADSWRELVDLWRV